MTAPTCPECGTGTPTWTQRSDAGDDWRCTNDECEHEWTVRPDGTATC